MQSATVNMDHLSHFGFKEDKVALPVVLLKGKDKMRKQKLILFREEKITDCTALADELASACEAKVDGVISMENSEGSSGMIVLERFFYRSNATTTLSIYFYSDTNGTALYLISTGGNVDPFFPCDFGTEAKLLNLANKALRNLGWVALEETAHPH